MAWSLVQQSTAQTTTSTNTLPANSTAGNLLVAVTGAPNQTAITAPAGWVQAASVLNGGNQSVIWFYPSNPGGLSSFTFAGPPGIFSVAAEFACAVPRAAVSDTGTGTAGAAGSVQVTTGGSTLAGDLVICAAFEHLASASAITWTDPGGFTEFAGLKTQSLANHGYAAYTVSAPAPGAQSATVTSSAPSTLSTGWTGLLVAFTPAGAPMVPQPVRPKVITQRRGRAHAGGKGAPLRNPTAGPVAYPAKGPVRARQPLPPRGQVHRRAGAPLRAAGAPAPLYPAKGPVQARRPLPPHGSTQSVRAAPPRNPGPGPALVPPRGPAAARQPLPPRGRCAGSPGAPAAVTPAGPPFRAAAGPAAARIPLPPRGRCAGTPPPPAAVTLANTFETGLSPGTAVTVPDSATGQAGTGFDLVTTGAGGTVAYDSANIIHGGLDCKIQATAANTNYVSWIHSLSVQPQVWFRLYCYLAALPPGGTNLWLFGAFQGGSSALCARFGITPSGQVLIQNAAQVSVATSFTKVSAGNWFRLEGYVGGTAGTVTARLFTQADSPVPAETITATGTSTLGVIDRVRFGITAAAGAQGPLWLDDVAVTNTGWLGPSSAVARPSQGYPAQARVPPLTPRAQGQVSSNPGTFTPPPAAGAPFPALRAPVQARVPLPPRGRAQAGGTGAPPASAQRAAALPAQGQPSRTRPHLPPAGRTAGNAGALASLLLVNNAAGGSNGATVTSGSGGNTGGTSGNFFNSVVTGGTNTLTFDNSQYLHPAMSYKASLGTTAGSAFMSWTGSLGIQGTVWFRAYCFLSANPTVNFRLFAVFGTALNAALQVTTAGKLRWQDNAGAVISTSAAAVPLGSWFRVEGFVTGSATAGQTSVSLYWPADAQVPVETDTSAAAQATVSAFGSVRFGVATSVTFTSAYSFWLGGLGVSNTGPLGPVSFTGPPSSGHPAQVTGRTIAVPLLRGRAAAAPVRAAATPPATPPAAAPLRQAVQARIPRTYRGHARRGNPGAPVISPKAGAAFRALTRPVTARQPLPLAGRTATSGASPVVNPLPPFPVYAPAGFHGLNVLTGPPASVLAEILRSQGGTGGRQRATFTTTQYTSAFPDVPSVITQVVWLC